ncbi:MAG: nucleotidyltransferase domain-containing protein [Desulfobacteraceae bacterium]|nr:nucleotidyltransferase domain-containing protein [Desulfobacteraceae bacterium]MBC2718951.1 nucleotidyltransferase domain-containing protein [Desulfobacteraceae bacterium]
MAVHTTSGELTMPEVVEQLKEKLREYPNIMFALLFGSHAKACQRASSDLDIALFFKQPLSGLDFLYLINELSDYTKKEVDLVLLNSASVFLRHQVMKHSVRLLVRDMVIYRKFREQTITNYNTYKFVSGMGRYNRQVFRNMDLKSQKY